MNGVRATLGVIVILLVGITLNISAVYLELRSTHDLLQLKLETTNDLLRQTNNHLREIDNNILFHK